IDGHAAWQKHHGQISESLDTSDDSFCLGFVVDNGVVHCAVRLDVGNLGSVRPREGVESTNLVGDFIDKLCGIVVNKAAAEGYWIVVPRVRAHGHAGRCCCLERSCNLVRVAGVETCGYVCGRDHFQHRLVNDNWVARGGFTKICVEI